MSARICGGVTADLDDGPVRTRYGRDSTGKQTAWLVIGEGRDEIAITVSHSSPDTLADLHKAVAELTAWTQRQHQLRGLPEVA